MVSQEINSRITLWSTDFNSMNIPMNWKQGLRELLVYLSSRKCHLQWSKVEAASLSIEWLKMWSVERVEGYSSLERRASLTLPHCGRPWGFDAKPYRPVTKGQMLTILLIWGTKTITVMETGNDLWHWWPEVWREWGVVFCFGGIVWGWVSWLCYDTVTVAMALKYTLKWIRS